MIFAYFLLVLSLFIPPPGTSENSAASPQRQDANSSAIDMELEGKLLKVKRVYVESFGDDKVAKILHAMVINSLASSKRFIITENKDRADAILKGVAIEKTSQELHATGEGTAVSAAAGAVSGSQTRSSGSVSGAVAALGAATQDSQATTETIDRAAIAVRLISSDGDLIWSSTQESKGAKYKGAGADVADKIVKQLIQDIEKIEKKVSNKQ